MSAACWLSELFLTLPLFCCVLQAPLPSSFWQLLIVNNRYGIKLEREREKKEDQIFLSLLLTLPFYEFPDPGSRWSPLQAPLCGSSSCQTMGSLPPLPLQPWWRQQLPLFLHFLPIFHYPFNQLSVLNPICLKDAEDYFPGSILTDTILSYKLQKPTLTCWQERILL